MPPSHYLHEHKDFSEFVRIVANERAIRPELIEKDYWIMHCLHGLTEQGFQFELKGGTSLSKGFDFIQRFSEDLDIRIDPQCAPFVVHTSRNHTKEQHVLSRGRFYDWLAQTIRITGIIDIARDKDFDDDKLRSGGIRLNYPSTFAPLPDLKQGILLEVGFDDTCPNQPRLISSWAYDKASLSTVPIKDNRAHGIRCYHPGYTLVEKLQAVSTKYRRQQAEANMPPNFMRHYYDIGQLLSQPEVIRFIGTPEYHSHKKKRFGTQDNPDIRTNEAFHLASPPIRRTYEKAYQAKQELYYGKQKPLDEILKIIHRHFNSL